MQLQFDPDSYTILESCWTPKNRLSKHSLERLMTVEIVGFNETHDRNGIVIALVRSLLKHAKLRVASVRIYNNSMKTLTISYVDVQPSGTVSWPFPPESINQVGLHSSVGVYVPSKRFCLAVPIWSSWD
ncbi:hypothetical protein AAG906_028784 [Vitis piasezkii]